MMPANAAARTPAGPAIAGMSQRQAAKVLGVNNATISRDLQNATKGVAKSNTGTTKTRQAARSNKQQPRGNGIRHSPPFEPILDCINAKPRRSWGARCKLTWRKSRQKVAENPPPVALKPKPGACGGRRRGISRWRNSTKAVVARRF
jgi:hypothetical protein